MTRSAEELGQILSRLHWQCWREDPPPLDVETGDLVTVLPALIRSGSVGLVWPRLQGQIDRYGAIALALEEGFRAQEAHNELCQREIASAVSRLRDAGIEPVLVKGWSVARLYPEGLVRPAGDIDLVVRKADFARAEALLNDPDAERINVEVDLKHPSIWEERPNEDFWERTGEIAVDGVPVRVLGQEDQLRMLCFHYLRHGGMRPLWLVDIALALETRSAAFDRDVLLGTDKVQVSWLMATLGLAHELVGANLGDIPIDSRATNLPAWLIPAVYRQWRAPKSFTFRGASTLLIENPQSLFRILVERWQEPITATVYAGAPINRAPRLPVQWLAYGKRIGHHLARNMPGQVADYIRKASTFQ